MATKKKAPEPVDSDFEDVELETDLTDRVLEATPERVLRFILAARRHQHIYKLLRARGYSAATAREAWTYIDKLAGFDAALLPDDAEVSADEKTVAKAMADIDAWDEPNFGLIDTALRRRFPGQHEFVFAGNLKARVGALSVASTRTMLQRLDRLEDGAERKSTRKDDHAALELLAERGVDKAERKKVAGWLSIVGTQNDAVIEGADAADAATASAELQRRNILIKLRDWLEEWTGVARVAVKRKRDRMHLGMARQKRATKAGTPEEPEPNEGDQG